MSTEPHGSTELRADWRLVCADGCDADGTGLSSAASNAGIAIPSMPATILRAQIDAGVYDEDLYAGDALTRIDQRLWERDWWYTLTFDVPSGHERYTLQFDGLSYRAEVWLNGELIAGRYEVVGSWRRFEFDVTRMVAPGAPNHLAVRIVPERRTPGLVVTDIPTEGEPTGVDLADTWADWLNFHYLGDSEDKKTFIPDKNSGIFRRVRLTYGGAVGIRHPYVETSLPQLSGTPGEVGDSAELTVRADVRNFSDRRIAGSIRGIITRDGSVVAKFRTPLVLEPRETHDLVVTPHDEPVLHLTNPDLWWPYIWGEPALHHLELCFEEDSGAESDVVDLEFGIRQITGHRDEQNSQPQFANPGSFFLKVNGRDYLVRGGAYSPDLFFESNDPDRVRTIMDHAKDLGFNLIRWEGHLIDDGLLELCDREGMPVMIGTMCCGAWERWHEWDAENYEVAQQSISDTVRAMRAHPAIALWSNGSDGLPPDEVLGGYHRALEAAHWQNPVLDTVSTRNRDWSGIHMNGPYTWRAPVYWFLPDNPVASGSCAEEGNNEAVPLLSSVRKMLGAEAAWPFGEAWSVHSGSINGQMSVTRAVVDRRFGGADTLEEFVNKAQIAQYEGARAHMEAYAARGWETNKFTIYWMMNSPWPSFFGHTFDWYWAKGGVYYGLKEALRPIAAVFDYFAEGDRETARIVLVNQSLEALNGMGVRLRVYRADGSVVSDDTAAELTLAPQSSQTVLTLARPGDEIGAVYFVRVTLSDADGVIVGDRTYWQAAEHDVPNLRTIDGIFDAMRIRQYTWPDFSSLYELPKVALQHELEELESTEESVRRFQIILSNPSAHIAFFVRVELRFPETEEEILPNRYSENFVTVYPGEAVTIDAEFQSTLLSGGQPQLHIEGVNLH